ncbi:hypothetical protein ACQJBY_070800 [Aegilops geniculata]
MFIFHVCMCCSGGVLLVDWHIWISPCLLVHLQPLLCCGVVGACFLSTSRVHTARLTGLNSGSKVSFKNPKRTFKEWIIWKLEPSDFLELHSDLCEYKPKRSSGNATKSLQA